METRRDGKEGEGKYREKGEWKRKGREERKKKRRSIEIRGREERKSKEIRGRENRVGIGERRNIWD